MTITQTLQNIKKVTGCTVHIVRVDIIDTAPKSERKPEDEDCEDLHHLDLVFGADSDVGQMLIGKLDKLPHVVTDVSSQWSEGLDLVSGEKTGKKSCHIDVYCTQKELIDAMS